MNFLEQLSAEWYASQGYFVRTNVKANRRPNGGWNNEIDVLAFNPNFREIVHIETPWDSHTWAKRKERFLTKKFVFTKSDYNKLVGSTFFRIRKRAIVGGCQTIPNNLNWGRGIEIITVPQFMAEICDGLKKRNPLRDIVPETSPCLRAIQFALAWHIER